MLDPATPDVVTDEEILARFVLSSKWIRKSDNTVKQDAFIPYPYPDLSVTRHKNLDEQGLRDIGESIAKRRPATLHGRADVNAEHVRKRSLLIRSEPTGDNPNHANVTGWPEDKPAQKIIAQELAADATFATYPAAT